MQETSRIVVIGASAGGVEALLRLAPQLSPTFAAPILLVLHIGAHRSHLAKLLDAKGPLRAVVAEHGVTPQPGTIYVAPSDMHLMLEHGSLQVLRGPKEHHARPAINPLFRSAALNYGPRVVGLIMTGMLNDGTAGLHAIKACGGTTVVQDPDDSLESSMPQSALNHVDVDHVFRLDALGGALNTLSAPLDVAHPFAAPTWLRTEHDIGLGKSRLQALATVGSPSGFTCPDCNGALFELKEAGPLRFLCHTGHAFSLQSLAATQEVASDAILWAGLRAVQEKEAILRRLAGVQKIERSEHAHATLAEADQLASLAKRIRAIVVGQLDG